MATNTTEQSAVCRVSGRWCTLSSPEIKFFSVQLHSGSASQRSMPVETETVCTVRVRNDHKKRDLHQPHDDSKRAVGHILGKSKRKDEEEAEGEASGVAAVNLELERKDLAFRQGLLLAQQRCFDAQQKCVEAQQQSVDARQQAARAKADCKKQLASVRNEHAARIAELESKLEASEARFRSTVEVMCDGSMVKRSDRDAGCGTTTQAEEQLLEALEQQNSEKQQLQQKVEKLEAELRTTQEFMHLKISSAESESERTVQRMKGECEQLQEQTKKACAETVLLVQQQGEERLQVAQKKWEEELENCRFVLDESKQHGLRW